MKIEKEPCQAKIPSHGISLLLRRYKSTQDSKRLADWQRRGRDRSEQSWSIDGEVHVVLGWVQVSGSCWSAQAVGTVAQDTHLKFQDLLGSLLSRSRPLNQASHMS